MEITLILGIIAVTILVVIFMVKSDAQRRQDEQLSRQAHTAATGHTQFEYQPQYGYTAFPTWLGNHEIVPYCAVPICVCKDCGKVIK